MGTKTAILDKDSATEQVSPWDVCDFILSYCEDEGIEVPHMKLHKLLFYCHAWCLVYYNKPLIKDGFEAWIHGPVNRKVWNKYKDVWPNDIPLNNIPDPSDKLPVEIHDLMLDVLEEYSGYTGDELSKLSHLEEPWYLTRGGIPVHKICHKIIPDNHIREYYGRRVGR